MSIILRRVFALGALVVLTISSPASAQIPDTFDNLKILPKDISKRELMGVMRSFSSALGKRCNYCHVGELGASLKDYDFASDENKHKVIARVMMTMTNDINKTHLPKLQKDHFIQVRCVTCHSGVDEPETIDNIVLEVIEEDGLEAAMAKYREIRAGYYGRAAYDFSAGPLSNVAETLAQEQDNVGGAITVMLMNIELNPEQSYSHLFLGQLYQEAGDKEAAIASVEKCLELDPENKWAAGILAKIKASK